MSDQVRVESVLYRGWSARLRPAWLACLPVAATGVRLALRRRLCWVLLGLASLHFLFLFATIYFKAQLGVQNPAVSQFVQHVLRHVNGSAETYREFMFAQGTVIMLMLAFAGETLVGNDYRHGGLTFYLSRRVSRGQYVLGKLLGIGFLVELTTTLPALLLYAEYGLLTDSMTYFVESPRILVGILAYGLVMAVALSLLIFALAAWLQRTVPLVMAWSCLFVLLPALGGILRNVYHDRNWLLLSYWRDLQLLGSWCFGVLDTAKEGRFLAGATAVIVAVCMISAGVAIPRVRAVKVVT